MKGVHRNDRCMGGIAKGGIMQDAIVKGCIGGEQNTGAAARRVTKVNGTAFYSPGQGAFPTTPCGRHFSERRTPEKPLAA